MAIKPTPASRNIQEKNILQNSLIPSYSKEKKTSIGSSKVYFNSDLRDTNQLEKKQSRWILSPKTSLVSCPPNARPDVLGHI
jgi:hypothetical protein